MFASLLWNFHFGLVGLPDFTKQLAAGGLQALAPSVLLEQQAD